MNLTARIAATLKRSGTARDNVVGAAAMPAVSRGSKGSGASSSRPHRATLAALALLVFVLAAPSSAVAAQTHAFVSSFGPDGTELTAFGKPGAVAVDESNGSVYVADLAAGTVFKFNLAGAPEDFSAGPAAGTNALLGFSFASTETQLAVSPTNHDLYTAGGEGTSLNAFQPDGEPAEFSALGSSEIGGFGDLCGVAVDANGDIYAAEFNSGVRIFTPSGEAVTTLAIAEPCNLAVDPQGALYVNHWHSSVEKLVPSVFPVTPATTYGSVGTIDPNASFGLSVDPTDADLYVDEGSKIAQYAEAGARIGSFSGPGGEPLVASEGIAVDGASGKPYVSNSGGSGRVEIFGPSLVLPEATTGGASQIASVTAELHGTLNAAAGPAAECEFQYIDEEGFLSEGFEGGQAVPCVPAGPINGSSDQDVSAALTHLAPQTTYYFRLVGSNENGRNPGAEALFSTSPAVSLDTEEALSTTGEAATLAGAVNPEGLALTECIFEYLPEGAFQVNLANTEGEDGYSDLSSGGTVPCENPDAAEIVGAAPVSVHAHIPNLHVGPLHFRLTAANANGKTHGEDKTATISGLPIILGESATSFATAVQLQARIDPNEAATSYRFEYGAEAGLYEHSTAQSEIPAGDEPLNISAHVGELPEATVLHFRLVAQNASGVTMGEDRSTATVASSPVTVCPNEAVRQQSNVNPATGQAYSVGLPDCRAFEQVTPVFKNGANVGLEAGGSRSGLSVISPSGDAAILASSALLGTPGTDPVAALGSAEYTLTRQESGWTLEPTAPLSSVFPKGAPELVSPANPTVSIWQAATPSQPVLASDLYLRKADGQFSDIGPVAPGSSTAGQARGLSSTSFGPQATTVGASADLSRVLFSLQINRPTDPDYLWPGDHTSLSNFPTPTSLYEYVGTGHSGEGGDTPKLVGFDNEGGQISDCGTTLGLSFGRFGVLRHAVSAGGSTVFFTALAEEAGVEGCATTVDQPVVDQLYAKIGPPGGAQTTVNVAGTSGCASSPSCDVTSPISFQGASATGSAVFFTTTQPLISSDQDGTNDLYECVLPGDAGSRPTPVGKVNPCPNLRGISVSGTSAGSEMQSLIGISKDGTQVYFIAKGVLTETPNQLGATAESGEDNMYEFDTETSQTQFIATVPTPTVTAQETPSGRYLVFSSAADLTPDDTSSVAQIFRYDAQTGDLIRASTGREGFNDNGNTVLYPAKLAQAQESRGVQTRGLTISSDGSYIAFQSSAALVPTAQAGANNVYTWHAGAVALISDGTDANPNAGLLGMSESGRDVFFTSSRELVGGDSDDAVDVYDARIDGGFPAAEKQLGCSGEECQGPLGRTPAAGGPAGTLGGVAAGQFVLSPRARLAMALKSCRRQKRSQRKRCEKRAKRRFHALADHHGASGRKGSK